MGRAVLALCMSSGTALACPRAAGSSDVHGVAVAFMLMGLCGFAFAITRANAVRRTFATSHHMADSDLDVLKAVVYTQRRRTLAFIAGCALALAMLASLPFDVQTRAVLSLTPTMLLAVGAFGLCRLQLLLALRDDPSLRVLSHGEYLFAARGRRLVGWVAAPPALVARASKLPVATLRH